ncbi:hypothetical protein NH339_04050 [Aeromicrobium sp. CnD17-E]|nr:hypothetical protein [Aeromicrobium sp. CnD17-E]
MGSAVVDDPSQAESYAEKIASLSYAVEVADAAAEAVAPKVLAARRHVLRLEADHYDDTAAAARAVLAKHQEKTNGLLQRLAAHEGEFAPAFEEQRSEFTGEIRRLKKPMVSDRLTLPVKIAELRARSLRMLLAGEDPRPLVRSQASIQDGSVFGLPEREFWPDCLVGESAVWSVEAALASSPLSQGV